MARLMGKHGCLQVQTAEQVALELWHAAAAGMSVPVHHNKNNNNNNND